MKIPLTEENIVKYALEQYTRYSREQLLDMLKSETLRRKVDGLFSVDIPDDAPVMTNNLFDGYESAPSQYDDSSDAEVITLEEGVDYIVEVEE